ncbi:MAG: molybdopterin molybdotransferase MoeA [Clostridiaceae bacterium]
MRQDLRVISLDEALDIVLKEIDFKLGCEVIDSSLSLGRHVSEDIKAEINVPDFKRSTVDGYAVRSKDLKGAGDSMPAFMKLKGSVGMGKGTDIKLTSSGDCAYVPTGGMLPLNSDTVVMIEYSDKLDEETVLLMKENTPGENVIDIGEDIEIGETIISKGKAIRPYEAGVLSSLGITRLNVFKKPVVGIISTGDEVIGEDDPMEPGKIRDINTRLLYNMSIEDGCNPVIYGHIKDDFELLKRTMEKALSECDIVLISGGSSMGSGDFTREVILTMKDSAVLFHGLAVKPGKPTIFGKSEDKPIFGLPGHPLACAVIYGSLVRPLIKKLLYSNNNDFYLSCEFTENHHKSAGRTEFLPVTVDEKDGILKACPIHAKSGMISGFAKAYGYIRIPRNEEGLKEGQTVKVYKL